ncbi:thiosulfate oxidation carrier complex protein SoxZ [Pseudomonadota bacterium]
MSTNTIEARAKYNNGTTTINALITHPMESGSRIGSTVSPHFIQEVRCSYKESILLTAQWGIGMPENPYLSFSFKGGEKGEVVILKWVDNKGDSDTAEVTIK